MPSPAKEVVDRICKQFVDEGKLVEAGWQSLWLTSVPEDTPKVQLDEMRMAFFAGAQHLFGSIMSILEPDAEPTEKDLQRMDLIHRELERFIEEFKLRHSKPGGSA